MSSISLSATQEEIEEELLFVDVQIKTLDPGADDFQEALAELQSRQRLLQSRLEPRQQANGTGMMDITPSRRPLGWGTELGDPTDLVRNTSDDESSATLSSLEHPIPSSSKRPRPTSRFPMDEPSSKRPTPDRALSGPSNPGRTPSHDFVDRARRRNEAAEASLRQQQAMQRADAAYAFRLSQATELPVTLGPSASSSQPRTQTTLSNGGGYHRLPPMKLAMDTEPSPLPDPQYGERIRTLPWQTKPTGLAFRQQSRPYAGEDGQHFMREPHRSSQYTPVGPSLLRDQLANRAPGHSAQVVDLTGSDSDDVEVRETGSRQLAPEYGAPGPSRPLTYSSSPFGSNLGAYHIPGAYPGISTVYSKPHQNPSFPSPQVPYAYHPTSIMSGNPRSTQMLQSAPTGELQYLLTGGTPLNPGTFNYVDSGDEFSDDAYEAQHPTHHQDHYANGYAGRGALYKARFDMLASYDTTKSKEEIEALLKNIRPDEDMPAHLRVKTPESMTIQLHKYQELGLTWLQQGEDGSNKGGILADDMGLGKTIQMLSLMVTRKSEDPRCKTTLIVAPVALMRQWKQEIQQKIKIGVNHRLTVFTHHGSSKKKDFRELQLYDVVLTTYGSLAVEVKKMEGLHKRRQNDPNAQPYPKEKCVLIGEDARWYRIILDEAQCIKNRSTQTAKAACMVNARYRWCMSGTPMMNSVEELFSLIRFLRIRPYSQWERFRSDFKTPLQGRDMSARETAMRRLQTLCKAIMLRRTKKSTFEGKPILVLPERTTEVDNLQFSEDERDLYQALETQSKLQFNKYLRAGTVGKSYTAILVLLLRLRQACCHPHLINDFGVSAAADLTEDQMLSLAQELSEPVVARIRTTNGTFECPVCYDITPNPAIFIPCGHDACSECFAKLTDPAEAIQNGEEGNTRFKCPNCRGAIDPKRVTDFSSFKKVHAPDMFTEQEVQAMQAAEMEEADESDEDSDVNDESNDESDLDEQDEDEEDEADQVVKKYLDDGTSMKAEDDGDNDDPNRGIRARVDLATTVKHEEGPADVNVLTWHNSNIEAEREDFKRTRGKEKGKGKGRAKEGKKKKTKKVKAVMTLAELKKRANKNVASRKEYVRRIRKDWITSAKIDKTMDILQEIMNGEYREKVLIFSQWTSLLDLLEVPIDDAGYGYRRYDGSMNARMRGDAVDDFRDDGKDVRIMLVSLKAGNAGLNLNMASQVIILDPFWNPYIEEQAIDRAHRIGQRLPVKVHRVLIENTVEDRILGIQEKKRALISEALDEKAGQSLSRLGVQELAYLFGVTANPAQQVDYTPQERRG